MEKFNQDFIEIEKTIRQAKKIAKEAKILSTIAALLALGTAILKILILF